MIIININTERNQLAATGTKQKEFEPFNRQRDQNKLKNKKQKKKKNQTNKMADYYLKFTKPIMEMAEQYRMGKNKEIFL